VSRRRRKRNCGMRCGRDGLAGFKFRRQHPAGIYTLDFYCPTAKLSVELDGLSTGMPEQHQRDEHRQKFLESQGIEEPRFWNHQWNKNREGVLLEISGTRCTAERVALPVIRKVDKPPLRSAEAWAVRASQRRRLRKMTAIFTPSPLVHFEWNRGSRPLQRIVSLSPQRSAGRGPGRGVTFQNKARLEGTSSPRPSPPFRMKERETRLVC
jgi:very-short-patch-repair endonuclease